MCVFVSPRRRVAVPSDIGRNLPCDRHPQPEGATHDPHPSTLDHAGNRNRAHRPLLRIGRLRVRRRRADPGAVRCAAALRERRGARHRCRDGDRQSGHRELPGQLHALQEISSAGSSTAPGRRFRPGASRRASSRSGSPGSPGRAVSAVPQETRTRRCKRRRAASSESSCIQRDATTRSISRSRSSSSESYGRRGDTNAPIAVARRSSAAAMAMNSHVISL